MSPVALLATALAVIAALAMLRIARARRDAPPWRRGLAVAGQAALAGLLWLVLVPPPQAGRAGALVVLTEGADVDTVAMAPHDVRVSLPGAPPHDDAEPVPDLGTALRRHPAAAPVRVVGAGLPARDRDAAYGHPLEFLPAPLPGTLVALALPEAPTRGRRFDLHGTVAGHAGGSVELLDPAGMRLDRARLDDTGRFRLSGVAGPAGTADYRLQWRRSDAAEAEGLSLPLQIDAGAPLRVLVVSGGASPELKFLRRWALDAGLALASQIRLGGGMVLGDDRAPLTAARLSELDLLVIDERAWRTLGAGGQATVREAVQAGLGLLLRLSADPTESERRALADWGFSVAPADLPRGVRLPGTAEADAGTPGIDDAGVRATDTAPLLSRRPLQLSAADGHPLLTGDQGEVLALWRAEGRGRVALWTLSDSFRLALAGRGVAHASLWSGATGTLARASGEPPLATPDIAWVGERGVLCGASDATALLDPAGEAIALVRDPATGDRACAAFWPARAGWHLRREGGRERAFLVRAPDEAPGLHAAHRRDATLALAGKPLASDAVPPPRPGDRGPWLLAWLLLAAALWWLERPRADRG